MTAATAESPEQPIDEQKFKVAEYKTTTAALSKLRNQYGGVLFDVKTPKGMKEAKAARKVVREYRTSLETKRKEIKAPALQRCRDIDDEAKLITAELRKLEDPIDEQIKAEEQRKQREKEEAEHRERERVEKIKANIDAIRQTPGGLIGKSVAELSAAAANLRLQPIGADLFAEFAQEALAAKQQALQQLVSMIEASRAQEELAEIKRKQAEVEPESVEAHAPAPRTSANQSSSQPAETEAETETEPSNSSVYIGFDPAQQDSDRTVVTTQDNPLDAIRADLIGCAGLYSSQADAVIESIQAGRIRHLSITE